MIRVKNYIEQYVVCCANNYNNFQDGILERVEELGAYKYLYKKSPEEIKEYDVHQFKKLFQSLYSTQRQKVYNDLEAILNYETGVSYFKGFINRIIKKKELDLDQMHFQEREQIKAFERLLGVYRLGFGKGTMSQIVHFCKPSQYPLSNTKSVEVIKDLYDIDVSDDYQLFTQYADELTNALQEAIEDHLDLSLELIFKEYKYVIFDDFVEFSYE